MRLTDVDTYLGWQHRGRQVREGEHGLKIVKPLPTRRDQAGDTDRVTHGAADDNAGMFFRTTTRFDVSQTDELDNSHIGEDHSGIGENGTEPIAPATPDAEPEAAPEAVLVASLREQAERAGYLVLLLSASAAPAASVTVDEQAKTITVYDDGGRKALSRFASTLATQATSTHDEAASGSGSAPA